MNSIKHNVVAAFAAVAVTAAITGSVLGGFNAVATQEEARANANVEFIASDSSTKVVVTFKRA